MPCMQKSKLFLFFSYGKALETVTTYMNGHSVQKDVGKLSCFCYSVYFDEW